MHGSLGCRLGTLALFTCSMGLGACDEPGSKPDDSEHTGDTGPTEEHPVVHIDVWCLDTPCTTLTATAVTDAGSPTDWTWTWGDETEFAEGQTVELPVAEGLSLLQVDVVSTAGSSSTSGVVSVDPVDVYADGVPPPSDETKIVFVPFADCDRIPVVSIGGCITGSADPIGMGIDGTYTSDQPPTPHAVWRVGLGLVEGQAPGTSPSDYGPPDYPVPASPAPHFTFYFQGTNGGTSTLLTSHGGPGAAVYSKHKLTISCDAQGKVDSVGHLSVVPDELDHDGDGFPAGEDCDETDPTRNQGC